MEIPRVVLEHPWNFHFFFNWPLEFPHALSSILLETPSPQTLPPSYLDFFWNSPVEVQKACLVIRLGQREIKLMKVEWIKSPIQEGSSVTYRATVLKERSEGEDQWKDDEKVWCLRVAVKEKLAQFTINLFKMLCIHEEYSHVLDEDKRADAGDWFDWWLRQYSLLFQEEEDLLTGSLSC